MTLSTWRLIPVRGPLTCTWRARHAKISLLLGCRLAPGVRVGACMSRLWIAQFFLRCRAFILENVVGLASFDKGAFLASMVVKLEVAGYWAKAKVLSSAQAVPISNPRQRSQ